MPLLPRILTAVATLRGDSVPTPATTPPKSVASSVASTLRYDGWVNQASGLGTAAYDKSTQATFCPNDPVARPVLSDLYRFDGIARKVITRPVWDSVRAGWVITSDDIDSDALSDALAPLDVRGCYSSARKWARLYGDSLVIGGFDDVVDGDLSQPLGPYREVLWLEVVAAGYAGPVTANREDESDPTLVTSYTINPTGNETESRTVHASRVHVVRGVELPDEVAADNDYWDDSVIQSLFTALSRWAQADATAANFLSERQYPIWRIQGLAQAIASEQTAGLVTARYQAMALAKSIYHAIVVDKDREEFDVLETSAGGIAEMLEIFPTRVAAMSNIPVTLLVGTSPGGLNATGESDVQGYYDFIEGSEQAEHLDPFIRWTTDIVLGATQGPTRGSLEAYTVAFNPLLTPSDAEVATTRQTIANTDVAYIRDGVLLPEEVRQSRYGGVEYSAETSLSDHQPTTTPASEDMT
jgi:phage-related protein (TIGR01555 family)